MQQSLPLRHAITPMVTAPRTTLVAAMVVAHVNAAGGEGAVSKTIIIDVEMCEILSN